MNKRKEELEEKRNKLMNKDKENKINQKIKNIYKIGKNEENSVLGNQQKPNNFKEKPLEKGLKWIKPLNETSENSKESIPFGEGSKEEELKCKAMKKVNDYRKSIIQMLDSEDEDGNQTDGLISHKAVSDEERDDDNIIMESSQRSIKPKIKEPEKDLTLESLSDAETIPIEGKPYFQKCEVHIPQPETIVLK